MHRLLASFLVSIAASSAVGCVLDPSSDPSSERSSLGASALVSDRTIFLVPVDERARTLCREETETMHCTQASADAARERCLTKVRAAGSAGFGDPCVDGDERCLRFQIEAASCAGDAPVYPDDASCASPRERNCSFYSACLEHRHPCGPDGYALGYGERYCYAFKNEARFSAAGVAFRDATMLCLQRYLASIDRKALDAMSCTDVTDRAFASHPACYTQAGTSICDLPIRDAFLVLHTIAPKDLLSRRALAQEASVVRTCVFHLAGRLFSTPAVRPSDDVAAAPNVESDLALRERYDFWRRMEREYSDVR